MLLEQQTCQSKADVRRKVVVKGVIDKIEFRKLFCEKVQENKLVWKPAKYQAKCPYCEIGPNQGSSD